VVQHMIKDHLPNMIDLSNFVRVSPDSGLLVCFNCRVLPATFQQLVNHFKKFVRNSIPLIMLNTLFESVGFRRTLHERSHDVPSHPTIGDMIERGKLPRKRVRILVRCRRGNTEGNIFRGMGHG
jgi:hypothetical protein